MILVRARKYFPIARLNKKPWYSDFCIVMLAVVVSVNEDAVIFSLSCLSSMFEEDVKSIRNQFHRYSTYSYVSLSYKLLI
jgi:hypothetical protein